MVMFDSYQEALYALQDLGFEFKPGPGLNEFTFDDLGVSFVYSSGRLKYCTGNEEAAAHVIESLIKKDAP